MPDIFISPISTTPKDPLLSQKRKSSSFDQAFSSYLFLPEDVRFETQEPGETIVLLLRKHWITNLSWLLTGFILLLVPIILLPAVFFGGLIQWEITSNFISFVVLVWYLVSFSYILVNFLLWYFTVSIVTNGRIIDIDFVNILHKKFAGTRISKVEDVTMRTGGFIRSIFDYGDVIIQTAAKEVQFGFFAVPHPEGVVRIINQLMGKTEEGRQSV